MNLIFAKLYEEYKRKNDSAKLSITLYISMVYFFLAFVFILPIKTFIDKKIVNNNVEYEKSTIIIVVFGLLSVITYFVNRFYIKKHYIENLTKKYKDKSINRVLLYFIVALTPVTLLIIAGTTTVLLTGGKILGHEIEGLFE